MFRIQSLLPDTPLAQLRPTQMTVGFQEVASKRKSWAKLDGKARRQAMAQELFPAVKGPGKAFYLLDHHHTALALLQEKAESVQVGLVRDLSQLSTQAFWTYLDHYSWTHAYDHRGRRQPFSEMPARLQDLKDDPYRSLVAQVRDAGAFAKADEPFLEFLWANYFRDAIPARRLQKDPKAAFKEAVALARSDKTSHLPGWSGKK